MNKQFSDSIRAKMSALEAAKQDLPFQIGNEIVSFFKSSWKKNGFENSGVVKWKAKKNPNGLPTLYGSGNLVNSIVVERAAWGKVVVKSDLPYSAIHNYGLEGNAFGKYSFKMPKRQFMGDSKKMRSILKLKYERKLNWVMRQR